MNDHDASYEEAARWVLKEHNDLLSQWLPEEKAEMVRKAL